MDYSALTQSLVDATAIILTAFVGLAIVYLKQYINKKITNDEFKASLLATAQVIENSVNSSIQGMSITSKNALADGKISKQELTVIRNKAIGHFQKQVSPELQKRLEAHIGDAQTFISNQIAAQIEKANKVTGVV